MVKVRKGFTLVELLIVIVIIGILAAAMMLSSGSATAAAEASTIISDLRSMKAASLMLYADSMDFFSNSGSTTALQVTWLKPYVDNPEKYSTGTLYGFSRTTDGKWWINFNATSKTPEVREKLEGKAKSIGLLNSAGDLTSANQYVKTNMSVWMVAR
jgi:prepilin-type N-terminal cleavage/methylation domain-containing protein